MSNEAVCIGLILKDEIEKDKKSTKIQVKPVASKLVFIVLTCCLFAISVVHGKPSSHEAMMRCVSRTGLNLRDIGDYKFRNQGCAIDCITKQGTVQTVLVKDGTKCHDLEDHKCHLGKCKGQDDQVVDTSDLYSLEIRIISAHVPDLDDWPTMGESDVFVTVNAGRNADPSYDEDEIICHTYVIQDNNNPRWKNFVCRPLPVRTSAQLRFEAFDSDKPMENHDRCGAAQEDVEYLMNKGAQKLSLRKGNQQNSTYFVEVEVTGKKYSEVD